MRRGYLLDTHVWLWHLTGSKKLPLGLRRVIEESVDECYLSPVSVWEAGKLDQKGVVRLRGGFRQWLVRAREELPLAEAPLNVEVAAASVELDLPHQDPADRFLAATAEVYELTLLTVDDRLTRASWLSTLSLTPPRRGPGLSPSTAPRRQRD